jgi:hypothetical protein
MNAYNTEQLSRKIDSLERRLEASENRERKLFQVLFTLAEVTLIEYHAVNGEPWKFLDALKECDPDT